MALLTHLTTASSRGKHLSIDERLVIKRMMEQSFSEADIARTLDRNRSTVHREIKKGTITLMKSDLTMYEAYDPYHGQLKYDENRARCGRPHKLDSDAKFIKDFLTHFKQTKSVDASVGDMMKTNDYSPDESVCTKTVYSYIEKQRIGLKNYDLPQKVSRKPRKGPIKPKTHKRIYGTSIEERPPEVLTREEFGHFEIDTIIGKKSNDSVILSLVERMTRKAFFLPIVSKTANAVNQAIAELRKQWGSEFELIFKTITADNGSEFSRLDQAVDEVKTDIYYAHPYSSFERGTNERHNGLLRRFIKKGTFIKNHSGEQVLAYQNQINALPRKILDYDTPEQLFAEKVRETLVSSYQKLYHTHTPQTPRNGKLPLLS